MSAIESPPSFSSIMVLLCDLQLVPITSLVHVSLAVGFPGQNLSYACGIKHHIFRLKPTGMSAHKKLFLHWLSFWCDADLIDFSWGTTGLCTEVLRLTPCSPLLLAWYLCILIKIWPCNSCVLCHHILPGPQRIAPEDRKICVVLLPILRH